MKKYGLQRKCTLGILMVGVLSLGGCASFGGSAASEWTPPVKQESSEQTTSSKNSKNLAREISYVQDSFSQENYLSLADNYAELGLVRMQRDTLEQGYRLFPDDEFLKILQNIYVNLSEEEEAVASEAAAMYQNMELEEYLAEGIHLAEDNAWFTTMMPKLSVGSRNYFQTENGQNKMAITVGYDEAAVKFVQVWFYSTPEKVLYMSYSNQQAQVLKTDIVDGKYNGAFELWTLNGSDGSITYEKGSLTDGEVASQDHTVRFHQGKAKSDVYDLWNHKAELKYVDLSGENIKNRSKWSQVAPNPNYSVYEPVNTETLQKDDPQVRIFDGQIQYLSEKGWVSLGTIDEYMADDPFINYAEEKKADDARVPAERKKEPELKATETSTQTTTTTTTTTTNNTTTSQTTTTRPASSSSTTSTVSTPQPATVREVPVYDNDDDDDDDDNSSSSVPASSNNGNNSNDNDSGNNNNSGNNEDNPDNGSDNNEDNTDSGDNGSGNDDNTDSGDNNGNNDDDNDAEIGWGEDLL
ncbi:MAG: hypothetical protein IJ716_15160 [Lachnospiraceae bacterium]|nr:hypothetical protein [Lachnospiraceae bacterium]